MEFTSVQSWHAHFNGQINYSDHLIAQSDLLHPQELHALAEYVLIYYKQSTCKADCPEHYLLLHLFRNPKVLEETCQLILAGMPEKNQSLRVSLRDQMHLTEAVLGQMAIHVNSYFRIEAAHHPNCPMLPSLLQDTHARVRVAAVSNKCTPLQLAQKLQGDPSSSVKQEVAGRLRRNPSFLVKARL